MPTCKTLAESRKHERHIAHAELQNWGPETWSCKRCPRSLLQTNESHPLRVPCFSQRLGMSHPPHFQVMSMHPLSIFVRPQNDHGILSLCEASCGESRIFLVGFLVVTPCISDLLINPRKRNIHDSFLPVSPLSQCMRLGSTHQSNLHKHMRTHMLLP